MSDLRDLYQEVILDHSKQPAEFPAAGGANRSAEGYNPLCGDKVTAVPEVTDGVDRGRQLRGLGLRHLHRLGLADDGSAEGQDRGEAEALFSSFHDLVTERNAGQPSVTWASSRCWPACASFRRV